MGFLGEIVGVVVAFMLVFGGLAFAGNEWEKSQMREACAVFEDESGRDTKFVEYTHWRFDCLTPTDGGEWISTFNLRDE